MPAFQYGKSKKSRFVIFCLLTFLSFMGNSSIYYFPAIFHYYQMDEVQIGFIMSSGSIPIIAGILVSAAWLRKSSAFKILVTGQIVMLLCYASFMFTLSDPLGAAISRFGVGLGFGLFFSSALVYARSLIEGGNVVFLFGIYATMIPLPNAIAPAFAEYLFKTVHQPSLVVAIFTAFIAVATIMLLRLPQDSSNSTTGQSSTQPVLTYWQIIKKRSFLTPALLVIVNNGLWGFVLGLMALYLSPKHVPVSVYFTAATLALLGSRFTLVAWAARLPRYLVVPLTTIVMAISFFILPLAGNNPLLIIISAALFGLGYSCSFPILSIWATEDFTGQSRAVAMALFTIFVQGSLNIAPLVASYFIRFYSFDHVIYACAIGAIIVALIPLSTYFYGRMAKR